jgi:hypothetical protein
VDDDLIRKSIGGKSGTLFETQISSAHGIISFGMCQISSLGDPSFIVKPGIDDNMQSSDFGYHGIDWLQWPQLRLESWQQPWIVKPMHLVIVRSVELVLPFWFLMILGVLPIFLVAILSALSVGKCHGLPVVIPKSSPTP